MDTLFTALRVAVSLGAVLAVIWYAHRRITRGTGLVKSERPITIIGRQGLSQKASVVIIETEGKRLLLGVTEHAITVLSDTPITADAPASASDETPFTSSFSQQMDASRSQTPELSARSFSRHLAEANGSADTSQRPTSAEQTDDEIVSALMRPRTRAARTSTGTDDMAAAYAPAITGAHTASPASHGLLRGSILSAETWKLSFAALRQGPRT